MNSAFWRYFFILSLLFLFWGEFFTGEGIFTQLAFNFAIFYPLGFWVGYRSRFENLRTAYLAALAFNTSSYVVAGVSGVPLESWAMVGLDFISLIVFIQIGTIMGKRAQTKE